MGKSVESASISFNLLQSFTIFLFLVVFGILGIVSFISKSLKGMRNKMEKTNNE